MKTKEITIPKEIRSIKIKNHNDLTDATETLSRANKFLDTLTKEKETLTKPLNQTLKEIRSRYKPTEDQLNLIIQSIRKEMTRYQSFLTDKENIVTQQLQDGSITLDKAITKLEKIDVQQSVKSESGKIKFKTVRKFRLKDISIVPKEYLLLNETLVRQTPEQLPGVEYWEEQIPYNFR